LSAGNTFKASTGVAAGYTATVQNLSISTGNKECHVNVGNGEPAATDGVIVCP